MAAEPKRRHSKARKRTRRASIKLEAISLVKCSKCGEMTVAHLVCKNCGSYKDKKVAQKSKAVITKA
jgi:large subunit ribosomal protein L32